MDNQKKSARILTYNFNRRRIFYVAIAVLLFLLLYISQTYNYLLFHSIAEMVAVFASFMIFIIVLAVWNHLENNNYLSFLGIAFFFIGLIDFVHTLAYKGMPIFRGFDSDLPIQLWILARYIQAFSLLIGGFLIRHNKQINKYKVFFIYSLIVSVAFCIIFVFRAFPHCFIEGYGLTTFKIVSEYIICIILIISAIVIWRQKYFFSKDIIHFLFLSIIFQIISELEFTSYINLYGFSNFLGHYLKILSIIFFCGAILITAVASPSKLLFISLEKRELQLKERTRQLEKSNTELAVTNRKLEEEIVERREIEEKMTYLSFHDQLTGLYNRRFFEEELKLLDVKRNYPITIVMADVNGLKLINDSFGHSIGDELLKKVADIMIKGCRADDIIARLGGDEFVMLLPNTDVFMTEQIIKRIKGLALKENVGSVDISVSFGWETKFNGDYEIQEVLKKAEDHMYKKKLFESPSMRGKTINAIISTLHEKNKREEQHSFRVSSLCRSMGEVIGLTDAEIQELDTVGLLHDIGKIAIDENILNKPEKLTKDEWDEIKRHPEIGYRILSTVNDMSEMAEYVLSHHERWDGDGYPKGLKGEEIPFVSRIIAIVDAYDAMTSERSYRSALSLEFALGELKKNAGIQFDPELVDIFIKGVLGNDLRIL